MADINALGRQRRGVREFGVPADFYDAGGGDATNRAEFLRPLGLSDADKADLVAFLQSLTGDPPDTTAPDMPDYQMRELGRN